MKPPANTKETWRYFGCVNGMTIEEALARVTAAAEGLIDPRIEGARMVGWVPMTTQEIERAKKQRAAAKRAAEVRRQKKQKSEIATLRRLAAKYADVDLTEEEQ